MSSTSHTVAPVNVGANLGSPEWQANCSCGWRGVRTTSFQKADEDVRLHRLAMEVRDETLPSVGLGKGLSSIFASAGAFRMDGGPEVPTAVEGKDVVEHVPVLKDYTPSIGTVQHYIHCSCGWRSKDTPDRNEAIRWGDLHQVNGGMGPQRGDDSERVPSDRVVEPLEDSRLLVAFDAGVATTKRAWLQALDSQIRNTMAEASDEEGLRGTRQALREQVDALQAFRYRMVGQVLPEEPEGD